MRVIALDVHRSFAEVAIHEEGLVRSAGRIVLEHDTVVGFARSLRRDDHVVLEATGNTAAIVRLLAPHARRVAVANPRLVRLIAEAKVKTDRIDAKVLAQLYAAGFLPEVWLPDEATELRRRLVAQRAQVVAHMTRLKNRIHSVLHANLIPRYRGELFSRAGRAWLDAQAVPEDQRLAVRRHLDELDRLATDLAALERALAERALDDDRVRRLMTVGGINATVAVAVLAAIGDVRRFPAPARLVAYLGLDPKVRQSGDRPAQHGRISKQGRAHARAMLVEAAWAVAATPGPLRAFFLRVKDRRGKQVAAVATARKLAVLIWHLLTKGEDYAWARPALVEAKRRQLELTAGRPSRRGGNEPGPARDYSIKAVRERERAWVEQAERAYARFVAAWSERPKPGRTGAAKEERL
jgi:transposase